MSCRQLQWSAPRQRLGTCVVSESGGHRNLCAQSGAGTLTWPSLAAVTVVVLALGSTWSGGEYSEVGISAILGSAVLCFTTIFALRVKLRTRISSLLWTVSAVVLALLNLAPGVSAGNRSLALIFAVTLAAASVVLCLARWAWLRWSASGVAVGLNIALTALRIRWGHARIDVFGVIQGATGQLMRGHNPYAAVYPSTTPGAVVLHYPYLPGLLLISVPFRMMGDIRVGSAVAMIVIVFAVCLIARRHCAPQSVGAVTATLVAMPSWPFMIAQAWPEIYVVAGIALWLALRERWPRLAILPLGVALCVVPTAVPLLVFPFLWWRGSRREIIQAAVIAAVMCVPFAAWAGIRQFVAATIIFQLKLPVRFDGLSANGLFLHLGLPPMPGLYAVVTWLVLIAIFARWRERDWSSGLLLGSALALVVFVTARWAVFDYYFVVACGLVVSLAFVGEPLFSS